MDDKIEAVNILIVDDRQENLLALEKTLASPDLKIRTASSGNDALAQMLEHDFALVLLDVQMPDMDGFETAELMRGNEETKHIPIIFVTAISKEQQHVFKGYDSGAVDYLFKPLDPGILENKVRIFCDLHRQKLIIKKQLEEIKVLRGILPICSFCKNIRDDEGYWQSIEAYFKEHSDTEFSHGVCPDCMRRHYPEFSDD